MRAAIEALIDPPEHVLIDGLPVIPFPFAQTAIIENGFVYVPHEAPWLPEYLHELSTFPNSKYDDQVDSTTQALVYMRKNDHLAIWAKLAS